MPMMNISAPPYATIVAQCPQCDGPAKLRVVEPDQSRSDREWHVFQCDECGLPRSYEMSR
jgi:hypothetical protein